MKLTGQRQVKDKTCVLYVVCIAILLMTLFQTISFAQQVIEAQNISEDVHDGQTTIQVRELPL